MPIVKQGSSPGEIGRRAEALAEAFLIHAGARILERNFRLRIGEIDLIARHEDTLVFIEVRKRRHSHFVDGVESLQASKQKRLLRTAEAYLQTHAWQGPVRFDVIALDAQDHIEWIQDALHQTGY
jgi:putative endonuclease